MYTLTHIRFTPRPLIFFYLARISATSCGRGEIVVAQYLIKEYSEILEFLRRLDPLFLIISFKHVLCDLLPLALQCDRDAWPGLPSLGFQISKLSGMIPP